MSDISSPKSDKINGFPRWDIQDAARTLIRAEEIRNDKRPKFYATVLEELTKQVEAAEEAALTARTAETLNKTFAGKK